MALLAPMFAYAGEPLLSPAIDSVIKDGKSTASDIGLFVEDLDDGKTLYEHDADKSFNPASVTKVVTTATALKILGPGYTFKTHLLRTGELSGGKLAGDLVVYGEGDPSITLERLWRIASLVKVAGVKEITGNLVVDDSYFDTDRSGAGYDDFDDDKAYTAPNGAVSATWNCVAVWVRPGAKPGLPAEIALDPPTSFVSVVNHATTGGPGSRRRVSVTIDKRVITINGSMPLWEPEKAYYRPIDDPPTFFGTLLREYLLEDGVVIRGTVKVGATPAGASEIFTYDSEPLGVIVRDLNKYSNNFTAEQLLKALGAARYGAPGTEKKGLDAIGEHLTSLGVPSGSWVIQNGSGLTRGNRVSPRLFVKVLEAAYNDFKVRGDFVASLGIAGEDGTLAHRMIGTPAAGAVRGKTGTVDGATCLAGYVEAANGHVLAFAILMNGVTGRTRSAQQVQDKVGALLATWGGVAVSPLPEVANVSGSAPGPAPAPSPDTKTQ